MGDVSGLLHGKRWSRVAGYTAVDSSAICVVTRMRFGHWWMLLRAYWYFWDLRRRMPKSLESDVRFAFSIESPWIIYSISVWKDIDDIHEFGGMHRHVFAARWAIKHCREIWSTEWALRGTSQRLT